MEKKWHLVYDDFSDLLELGLIEVVGEKNGFPMFDITEKGQTVLKVMEANKKFNA